MSEKLSLQWNDFRDDLHTAMTNLRKDTVFTDVTLVCEDGQQVEAHKAILVASSPFFQTLFARNKHPHPLIYMRSVNSDNLVAIVDFLYCGETNVQKENLNSFLSLADELQLKGLIAQKFEKISEGLQPDISVKTEDSLEDRIPILKDFVARVSFKSEDQESSELDEKIEFMMSRTLKTTANGRGKQYTCKVCGKEGQSINIKQHIEAMHVEGISIACNICHRLFKTRRVIKNHMQSIHKERSDPNSVKLEPKLESSE